MLKRVLISVCIVFSVALFTHTYGQNIYTKTANGVIIKLPEKTDHSTRLLQLQVISDNIIHVKATPDNTFSTAKSLMAVKRNNKLARFSVSQNNHELLLNTASLIAHV